MAPSSPVLPEPQDSERQDKIKLRKPAVEKVRRDRINTCIEQLRLLLQAEFPAQPPHSKLEKADILEVAVKCIQQRCLTQAEESSTNPTPPGFGQGYLRCLKRSTQFLSYNQPNKGTQDKLSQYFHKTQLGKLTSTSSTPAPPYQVSKKQAPPNMNSLWRPW